MGNSTKYDKISKKYYCCGGGINGLRLNPKRFSVQRLRINFLYFFRRWKSSYRNVLRALGRINLVRERQDERESSERIEVGFVYSSSGGVVRPSLAHSNSFCSEAIADCLEFIKMNSVSVDDERKPMLKQE